MPPKFVQRVARIPELLTVLADYPDGLALGDLAERFDTDAATLAENLRIYFDLESWGWGDVQIFRRSRVEFVSPDDTDDDPDLDHDLGDDDVDEGAHDVDPSRLVVRSVRDDPTGLGIEHLTAGELAVIYTAGVALLDVEPDDDLEAALSVIAETMYGDDAGAPSLPSRHRLLEPLREACAEHRRVRIVYSRAWHEGVLDRVVEPLRLLQTHRGWELDAGPVGAEGDLRTYLLSNVRDVEVLDETFEPPARVDALLAAQRRTSAVRMRLAQDARWAADMYAEHVTVVSEDDETFVADLELLPPVGRRVGLVMLASGPDSVVLSPGSVLPDVTAMVDELIRHHSR